MSEKKVRKSQAVEIGNRDSCGVRMDLLDPEFLKAMGIVMAYGANHYGVDNWQKGLHGEKSGLNHAMIHLTQYMEGELNDHFHGIYSDQGVEMHLAQVAVNAMFEFWHYRQFGTVRRSEDGQD